MPKFNWLHLTDLHVGMGAQRRLWPNIENEFFQDLERLRPRCGPWDAIFFTGDLVQSGTQSEFDKLDETLSRLYDRLHRLDCDPVLFTVPGNHDLKRPEATTPEVKLLGTWKSDPELREEFWRDSNSPYRRVVNDAFKSYVNWVNSHKFPRAKQVRNGQLPGDFSATIELASGFRVGIVGLNVAFLQLTGANFQGKLAVGASQLVEICGEHYGDWFASHNVCFLMTHQPKTWLDTASKNEFDAEIALPGRFVAHLSGHMHEHDPYTISTAGSKSKRSWQGCSLFGLEKFGKQRNEERRHGYTAGSLEWSDQAAIRLWPREAQQRNDKSWQLIRAIGATVLSDEGMAPEPIELHQTSTPTSTSTRQKFRLLLLSTEKDLGESRILVANHLRTALGIDVDEQDRGNDTSYDACFLLQGWWWDDGQVAKSWGELKVASKLAFLVNEESSWPPRLLSERAGEAAIQAFRAAVKNPKLFNHPDELPELVNESVGALLTSRGTSESVVMSPAERKYLEFRLPAWLTGRTARSRAYLVDSEHVGELYQSALYLPMDATSEGWVKDDQGNPVPVVATDATKANAPARVRWARWVSVAGLPRVVLVGAPGGGKTVALTRIAAELAHACLGRSMAFEPELHLKSLRAGTGVLPLPVVLEATWLAGSDSDINSLVGAVGDELGSTGDKLHEADIKLALGAGRYMLLIDALDEVPEMNGRLRVLNLLKGAAAIYPNLRMVLTSRMAHYTGGLGLEPGLKVVELAPLDDNQIQAFCAKWTAHRKRDTTYGADLMEAVTGLGELADSAGNDRLPGNPLMLTAICMVFERHRRLPDDRGSLCDLLIDDLCRSRVSKDEANGWKLDDIQKKDLLQRIALGMQKAGAQEWPLTNAIDVAMALVPPNATQQARRYVDWAADHTGLLRFEQTKDGAEKLRFWHRLFREYLAARQIAQHDSLASAKADYLWQKRYLISPFWEDVIRLLPRALGTIEKAQVFRDRIQVLAEEHSSARGRLHALAMAVVIENRDLFPSVSTGPLAEQMADLFERERLSWAKLDRTLFLRALGRLDPNVGDPRLRQPRWIRLPSGAEIGWAPVTVQELRTFLESPDRPSALKEPRFLRSSSLSNSAARVNLDVAEAYCAWSSQSRDDGKRVGLISIEAIEEGISLCVQAGVDPGTLRGSSKWAFLSFLYLNPVGAGDEPDGIPVDMEVHIRDGKPSGFESASLWQRVLGQPFRCQLIPDVLASLVVAP